MQIIINSPKYGQFVSTIDDCDSELIKGYSWHIRKGRKAFYVGANICKDGRGGTILLHRFLMGFPDSIVGHKDTNTLNNRRSNLMVLNIIK